jgi:hypothetical protein
MPQDYADKAGDYFNGLPRLLCYVLSMPDVVLQLYLSHCRAETSDWTLPNHSEAAMSLETLIREPSIVTVAGEDIEITQIRTKHIPAVLRISAPIFGVLSAAVNGSAGLQSDKLISLITEHAESVISLVAIGARKTEEWVGELELDDLIVLASAVIEVNALFFAKAVLPALTRSVEKVGALAAATAGTKPSNA